jgi:predicted transcriptional regulator
MKKFADQMADLDERRKTAGITYVELSKASDTALVNLSRYRNGHQQPTVDRWIVIQEALEKLIADRAAAMNALASS